MATLVSSIIFGVTLLISAAADVIRSEAPRLPTPAAYFVRPTAPADAVRPSEADIQEP